MPSDSEMIDRVHVIDKEQREHKVKIGNLESWVGEIHKTLKSVEKRVTLATGAFLIIELYFKIWGK